MTIVFDPDFIVRRGNIDIRDLYSGSPDAKYFYKWGVNWRAAFAFVAGFAVPLPGVCLLPLYPTSKGVRFYISSGHS